MHALVEVADEVDVIISSTDSARRSCSTRRQITRCSDGAAQRPLCIVDMAVPRDIDAAAGDIPGVTLIDIDELGRRVERRLDQRRETIPAVEKIIDTELERTVMAISQRDTAGPAITELVEWAEALRAREIDAKFRRCRAISMRRRASASKLLTRSMVRKLLHGPVTRLREAAGDPAATLAIREAFRLDR